MVVIKEKYHKERISSSMWQDPFKYSRKPVNPVIPPHISGTNLDFPTIVKKEVMDVEVMPITSYLDEDGVEETPNASIAKNHISSVTETVEPHIRPTKHGHVWYVRHKETGVTSGATAYVNIYTYTVPNGMIVYLKALGHSWFPNTDFKIVIDDKIFADYNYQWGDPNDLFKFPEGSEEVRKHIKFFVKNGDTSNHDYDCVFSGWVESISDVKKR